MLLQCDTLGALGQIFGLLWLLAAITSLCESNQSAAQDDQSVTSSNGGEEKQINLAENSAQISNQLVEPQAIWQQQHQQQSQYQTPGARRNELGKLERRIDRLEFELRKSLHQLQQLQKPSTSLNIEANEAQMKAQTTSKDSSLEGVRELDANNLPDPYPTRRTEAEKLSDLGERLNLVEKFITVTTSKLYEMELKLTQLDKCECQISCKWRPKRRHTTDRPQRKFEEQTISANDQVIVDRRDDDEQPKWLPGNVELTSKHSRVHVDLKDSSSSWPIDNQAVDSKAELKPDYQLKADGQVWRDECDICSCHRGRVTCKRLTCPTPNCADPQQVRGKCCPVCYKSCTYNGLTARHGNKLVINSNEQTCKECLCLDGRFQCQRVELGNNTGRQDNIERANIINEASSRFQRQATGSGDYIDDDAIDDAIDDHTEDMNQLEPNDRNEIDDEGGGSGGRSKRRVLASVRDQINAPLFCPSVECPVSEQIQLENDCCTYCRDYDFCKRPQVFKLAKHAHFFQQDSPTRCHPNADCTILTNSIGQSFNQTNPEAKRSIQSMFKCECRQGFEGDGQHLCLDVDECSDQQLNDCDPKTTRCVNLVGSYECQCKRGFKMAPPSLPKRPTRNSSMQSSIDLLGPVATVQAGERQLLQKCLDLNECLDGKLNRCHPQAKCINLQGSYKCQCKRGYLGNGFECHKWFSSAPNVAAYLYRHSDLSDHQEPLDQHNQSDKTATARNEQENLAARVSLPLNEEDDDLDDQSDDQDDDPSDRIELADNRAAPNLSDSHWAPLRFNPDAQQGAQTSRALNFLTDSEHKGSNSTSGQQTSGAQTTFTRTMFFQPPPKLPRPRPWWDRPSREPANITAQATSSVMTTTKAAIESNSNSNSNVTEKQTSRSTPDNWRQQNDISQPLASSTDALSATPNIQQTTLSIQTLNAQQTQLSALRQLPEQTQFHTSTNQASNATKTRPIADHKRGTIIASASTSPRRGASPMTVTNSRRLHSSAPLSQQQYKTVPSSASPSSSVGNLPGHWLFCKRILSMFTPFTLASSQNLYTTANIQIYWTILDINSLSLAISILTVLSIYINHTVTIYSK